MTRPKFPLGFRLPVDRYVGVVGPAHNDPVTGKPHPTAKCWITAVRAAAKIEEDEEGTPALVLPTGWEYLVTQVRTGDEWGWVPEAEIAAAGYSPSDQPELMEAA